MGSDKINAFLGEYRFLSNFYECPFEHNGKLWLTVEHAYQASKATNEKDWQYVRAALSPGIAKKRGRSIEIRPDWDEIKLWKMKIIVMDKFMEEKLRPRLMATGDAHLEEGNSWGDVYWGVCNGVGENWLGKILMDVRSALRESEREGQSTQ